MDLSEYITGEWSQPRPTSYNTRDLLTYAVGIGCDEMRYIYEQDEGFAAFPLYPVVLASHKGDTQDIDTWASSDGMLSKRRGAAVGGHRMPALPGTRVGVAAERSIEILRPLPTTGANLLLRSRLIGVHKKGSGALTEQEFELADAESGEVICRQVQAGFAIGASGFIDAGETRSVSISMPEREPDAVVEETTSAAQAHIYRLSGDYNPLHIDPEFPGVAGGGFRAPILHGLCTMGVAARAVLKSFAGNEASALKTMGVRFAAPVVPGETLVTEMWQEEADDESDDLVIFRMINKDTGKECLSNGYATLSWPKAKL
jgi:peroxisomal enoyl-CoA hydratase 2